MNPNDPSDLGADAERIDNQNQQQSDTQKKKPKNSKLLVELVVCILLPTLILKKFSSDEMLGANLALIAALSLPLMMAIYEFVTNRKIAFVPALGFISTLLTGGIGLLHLPTQYIAIKEALVPLVIGIAVVISSYTSKPLVRVFIYNDMIMDTDKIASHLKASNKENEFDQVMIHATWMMAASLLLSSALNYLLARWIVVSETGSDAFNDELGTLTLMSYPVIVLPCMVITMFALFYVIKNIKRLTGLGLEDVLHQ